MEGKGLYAAGPLRGANFVRFLVGDAFAIVRHFLQVAHVASLQKAFDAVAVEVLRKVTVNIEVSGRNVGLNDLAASLGGLNLGGAAAIFATLAATTSVATSAAPAWTAASMASSAVSCIAASNASFTVSSKTLSVDTPRSTACPLLISRLPASTSFATSF